MILKKLYDDYSRITSYKNRTPTIVGLHISFHN